jgi:hypothetical protein
MLEWRMMPLSQLIAELLESGREATDAEIGQLREHVARAGFDPEARERVRGRGAGIVWRGRTLRGRDVLPPAEAHYVRHVLKESEWPDSTTFGEYLESIDQIVRDDASGVFISRYQGVDQIGFLGRSREWEGSGGEDWILVEFRLQRDHITTAFQVASPETVAANPYRSGLRWLAKPL